MKWWQPQGGLPLLLAIALAMPQEALAQAAPPPVTPAATPAVTSAATPAADGPQFSVQSYVVEGDNPLGAAAAQAVLAPFTGARVALDRLQAAAEALERALHEAGYGFYRVILPPQDSAATVKLKILQFNLGQVAVKNQNFFGEANVRASLPALKEGASPNTLNLARDLALANENPSKRVVAAFRPGATPIPWMPAWRCPIRGP